MHQASTRILILPGLRRTNNFGHLRSIALGCKSGPTSLTCLSGLPTDVKHGFRASSASFSSLSGTYYLLPSTTLSRWFTILPGPEEPVGTSGKSKVFQHRRSYHDLLPYRFREKESGTTLGQICNRSPYSIAHIDTIEGAVLDLHTSPINLQYDRGHSRLLHSPSTAEPNRRRFHENHA